MDNANLVRCCSQCQIEKPLTREFFHYRSKAKLTFCTKCIDCARKDARDLYHSDPQRFIAEVKQYTTNNKVRVDEYQHHYRDKNAVLLRKKSREWAKAHPEKVKQQNHLKKVRRRSRSSSLPLDFTIEDWERCLSYWNNQCCICGRYADLWHIIAKEHWIPISSDEVGNPGTVPSNILPMCHSTKGASVDDVGCNNLKSDRSPTEWVIERFGKQKGKRILRAITAYFDTVRK